MRNKRMILIASGVAIAFLLIAVSIRMYSDKKVEEPKYISAILYGNTIDRWDSLKQGIEQAGKDYGAEINFVVMSTDTNSEEQLSLIQREIDNGAEGIILAASDSDMDLSSISFPSKDFPIICVESGVNDQRINLVSADNYTMGESLALEVIAQESPIAKIAIVMDNQQRNSVKERYEGFYNKVVEKFYNFTFWRREEGESRPMISAQRELVAEAVDVVVALDNTSLEAVIDATLNLNKKVKIYGIANSDKAVYYLDTGRIKNLVYQDEFSIGYIGIESLLGKENYNEKEMSNYIKYHIVNDETLYLPENERVLFPFVK
ncbi:substrate-binding domain-containing protein [Konateibacter massiliensis]|uniref:substrate-binding domain-containing protein n=1 Tax=Konateibacter massiliensis TaxID=2002841 RepID=UPI000C153190|nr:substrate-binding domain-containing protein [Konateibacter massiliensis]